MQDSLVDGALLQDARSTCQQIVCRRSRISAPGLGCWHSNSRHRAARVLMRVLLTRPARRGAGDPSTPPTPARDRPKRSPSEAGLPPPQPRGPSDTLASFAESRGELSTAPATAFRPLRASALSWRTRRHPAGSASGRDEVRSRGAVGDRPEHPGTLRLWPVRAAVVGIATGGSDTGLARVSDLPWRQGRPSREGPASQAAENPNSSYGRVRMPTGTLLAML